MRPNWFIAFPISAGNWYETVITKVPAGIKSFEPIDLHITFAFLGPVGIEKAMLAWDRAQQLTIPPLQISLAAMTPFGNPMKPSAYAFTLNKGRDELAAILVNYRDELLRLSGKKEDKYPNPTPHLTVARPPRDASDELRKRGTDWATNFPIPDVSLPVDSIALYTWSDDREMQQFKIVESSLLD